MAGLGFTAAENFSPPKGDTGDAGTDGDQEEEEEA